MTIDTDKVSIAMTEAGVPPHIAGLVLDILEEDVHVVAIDTAGWDTMSDILRSVVAKHTLVFDTGTQKYEAVEWDGANDELRAQPINDDYSYPEGIEIVGMSADMLRIVRIA